MFTSPSSPTTCLMTPSIRLVTVAPNAELMFVPQTGKFQTTAVLLLIIGSFQSTLGHAVTSVEEDFANALTIIMMIKSMFYLIL